MFVASDFFGSLDPCFGDFDFLVVLSFEQGAYVVNIMHNLELNLGGKRKFCVDFVKTHHC